MTTPSAAQHSLRKKRPDGLEDPSSILVLRVQAPWFHRCSASLPKDIKYIEVTSTRPVCHDGPRSCCSPSVTPPFGSPCAGGLLLSRDLPRETRSSSESLIFSGSQGRGHQRPTPPSASPSSHPPASPSISIPGMGSKISGPHGLGSPLAASPSLEKGLGGQGPQLGSRISMLSGSPVSDVSYVFGR